MNRQQLTIAIGQRKVKDLLLIVRVVKMRHGALAVAFGAKVVASEVDLVSFERHKSGEVTTCVAESDGILETEARLPVQWQINAWQRVNKQTPVVSQLSPS